MRRVQWPPAIFVACLLALIAVELSIYEYLQARANLHDRREELSATQSRLADTLDTVDGTRTGTRLTRQGITTVSSGIDALIEARTLVTAYTGNVVTAIAETNQARTDVDVERFLVGAAAGETRSCFDGVSSAVAANRHGDGQAAVDVLRRVSGQCSRTLAASTGARFPFDFADPFVLRVGGRYYGYSTNAGAGDVQVITSTDLERWELVGNALAGLPPWATPGATWAPAVLERNGQYVAYYAAREKASERQCISVALAASPTGPFVDLSAAPLVCQRGDGGSIDPSPFVDGDGRPYLLWKSEGLGSVPPTLWSQELSPDGLKLVGTASALASVDRDFEHGVVEAPSLLRSGGSYFLVYSAGSWSARTYTTAYATCSGPRGPCTKPTDGRILRSGARLAGPGGAEVFHDAAGAPWVAFHAYSEPAVGYPSSRYLYVARLRLSGATLRVDAAT